MYRRTFFFLVCSFIAVNMQSQSATRCWSAPPDSVLKKVLPPGAVATEQTLELKTGGETFLFYFAQEKFYFTTNVLFDSSGSWVNHSVDTIRHWGCFYRPGVDTAWWANLDDDPANELCVIVSHSWLCDTGTPYFSASFYDDPAHRFALLPVTHELAININLTMGNRFAMREKVTDILRQNGLPRK
jgi:hypothetical protein